jgi:hypothetical protein
MRTTKRFTPEVLARFERQGRGTGTHEHYIPWHGVSRGDPASCGRSHLLKWRGRLREFLSDGELNQQLFAAMLPDVHDSLEQFPLPLDRAPPLLARYGASNPHEVVEGTLSVAARLGIKHPTTHGSKATAPWVMTSDLVITFESEGNPRSALALAFKPAGWAQKTRTTELLALEREFWEAQGIPWLLITPDLYERSTALTLRRSAAWALGESVDSYMKTLAVEVACALAIHGLSAVLDDLTKRLGERDLAQRSFWQAVWSGDFPMDLRHGWRPNAPLRRLDPAEFWNLNPIAARRSAWI